VDVAGQLQYAPVEIPLDSLSTIAAAHRPDLAAAAVRVDQSRSLHALATAALFPVPAVGLVYQPGGLFPNASHYAVGFGVSVPLFYWNGGERVRASAAIGSAMVSERRTETQVATDVAQALDAYLAARDLARRYAEGLVAKASRVLADTRYAYETGAISQLDLLDAIREYADTRSDYYSAVRDYWVSLYALSRATGRELIP
jgi:outer membrane protein, heavy metal efflux system